MRKMKVLANCRFKLDFIVTCLLLLTLWLPTQSLAQKENTEGDEFTLEEITVTAEKREASLQKVPLAIDVVRPEDMNTKGVFDTQDLGKILPDLQINMSAANYMQINLREIPALIFNPEFETTVSMHVDGVQLTRNQGFNNYFFDMQRVEVLKGPVGTLYGRGSTAGAINIITQKAILGEFNGNVSMEVGNYNERRYMGAINIPIADKLAIRLAGRYYKHDGYTDVGYNDANGYGARSNITWKPTDKDVVTATFDTQGYDNEGGGSTGVYLNVFGNLSIVPNTTTNPNNLSGTTIPDTWSHAIILPYQMAWFTGDDYLKKNGGRTLFQTSRPRVYDNYNDNESYGVTLQHEHEFDFGYLTTLYGYRALHEIKDWVYNAVSLTPTGSLTSSGVYDHVRLSHFAYGNTLYVGNKTDSHFNSIEMHMTSKSAVASGDRLEWVVGGIMQDDRIVKLADPSFNVYWEDLTTKTKALFGQTTVNIYKDLNLTGGLRQSWDDKYYYGKAYGTFALIDFMIDPATDARYHRQYGWNELTYKANLSYQLTDDSMIYGGYSKGYKTGNVQNDGTALPPEFLDAYESGIKSRFFNNRLQINASVYYYNYKNFNQWTQAYKCTNYKVYAAEGSTVQTGIYTPGANNGPDATIQNVDLTASNGLALLHTCSGTEDSANPGTYLAVGINDYDINDQVAIAPGGAEQRGISGDIMFLITSKDNVNLTARWSKNEWKNYNLANAILARYPLADNVYNNPSTYGDTSGVEFGASPFRGNITYSHTEYIEMDSFTFNTTAYYTGKGVDQRIYNARDGFFFMPGVDDYWMMDASITYNSKRWVPEGTDWQIRIWGTNIFDSQQLRSISYATGTSYDVRSGTISGEFVDPRTYGASLTFNF
jgi:iron complex outermembrane recepter protein